MWKLWQPNPWNNLMSNPLEFYLLVIHCLTVCHLASDPRGTDRVTNRLLSCLYFFPSGKTVPRGLDIWTPDNNRLDIMSLLMFTGWQPHLECMSTVYHSLSDVYRISTLSDRRLADTQSLARHFIQTHPWEGSLCASASQSGFPLNSYVSVIICGIRWDLLTCGCHAYTCRATTGMKITLPVQWLPYPSAWYLKLYLFLFFSCCCWYLKKEPVKKDGKSSWGCSDWEAAFVENE